MKRTFVTYQLLVYLLLIGIFLGCGGADMESRSPEPQYASEEESMAAVEENSEAAEAEYTEGSKKDEALSVKKWKNKAKQQLESIEDLMLILNDSTLDPAFKVEIEKELSLLYENALEDTLLSNGVEFKNFKALKLENGDTMSLQFKNHKEILKAEFIVVSESKDFGGSIEFVERLKILSIEETE